MFSPARYRSLAVRPSGAVQTDGGPSITTAEIVASVVLLGVVGSLFYATVAQRR